MKLLQGLATLAPELTWGLLSRGTGLVFLISFWSFSLQIIPIAGRTGIAPIQNLLRAVERDFPTWKRFAYLPSLLWLDDSDRTLRALCLMGCLLSASIVVGGPHVPWAFAGCYVIYLSFDRPLTLVYPWDCLLFEASFWAMFLPATRVLPALGTISAPLPAVAWAYRLLVFRVMLGFGKNKFFGSRPEDSGFLQGFLVSQPLPTRLGWLAQKLPLAGHKLGLLVMFVVEIPLSFAVFAPGPWSALAALLTMGLMVAIWLTGNFGYFNIAVIVLALSWFDSESALRLTRMPFFVAGWPGFVNGLFVVHCVFAALGFSLNTFSASTWHMWSPWLRIRRRWLAWPIVWARATFPFRAVHAYGVFPSQAGPAARFTLVLEASWDDETWHELSFRYWPTQERSAPKWCAPHHERFDQAVVYEAVGLNEQSVFRGIAGRFDPYSCNTSIPLLLMHRLLAGTDASCERFYDRSLPRQLGAPRVVRVRTHLLEPTSLAELRKNGRYWTRELAGPHLPPLRLHDGFWDAPPAPPELWHFEDRLWLARSRVGDLMRESERGAAADTLVRRAAPELTDEDIDAFWKQFVPSIPPGLRSSWQGLRAHVERYREQYDGSRLYRFERIANLYALMLFARLEPLYLDQGIAPLFGKVTPSLDVKSNYHLHLLTHQIVAEGRARYDEMLEEPRRACGYAAGLNLYASQIFHALLRYEKLVYQSQKLRLIDLGLKMPGRSQPSEKQRQSRERGIAMLTRAFGAIEVAAFLTGEFTHEEDVLDTPERWPNYRVLPSGHVERTAR
jgi:hypothetical protein